MRLRKAAIRSYAEHLHRAKFIVCPRGVGLSSVRLFEAMRVGICPVIVSDRWLPPPFVDWSACSIRLAERDLPLLPMILREREGEWLALGSRARREWEKRYAPANVLNSIVEACLDIEATGLERPERYRMALRGGISRASAQRTNARVRRWVAKGMGRVARHGVNR
jgi:hypothetical protein